MRCLVNQIEVNILGNCLKLTFLEITREKVDGYILFNISPSNIFLTIFAYKYFIKIIRMAFASVSVNVDFFNSFYCFPGWIFHLAWDASKCQGQRHGEHV